MAEGGSADLQTFTNYRQLYRVRLKGPEVPSSGDQAR